MNSLAPRALSLGRLATQRSSIIPTTSFQRLSLLPTIQIASISLSTEAPSKPKPAPVHRQPKPKKKIFDRSAPTKRAFIPPPTKTEEELNAVLPYFVRRTPYSQLAIYRKFASGGTRIIILIKKVDGDRRKFVTDITEALKLEKDDVRLNPITQHIEIKVCESICQVRIWRANTLIGKPLRKGVRLATRDRVLESALGLYVRVESETKMHARVGINSASNCRAVDLYHI